MRPAITWSSSSGTKVEIEAGSQASACQLSPLPSKQAAPHSETTKAQLKQMLDSHLAPSASAMLCCSLPMAKVP